jgi:hypothetical protein
MAMFVYMVVKYTPTNISRRAYYHTNGEFDSHFIEVCFYIYIFISHSQFYKGTEITTI